MRNDSLKATLINPLHTNQDDKKVVKKIINFSDCLSELQTLNFIGIGYSLSEMRELNFFRFSQLSTFTLFPADFLGSYDHNNSSSKPLYDNPAFKRLPLESVNFFFASVSEDTFHIARIFEALSEMPTVKNVQFTASAICIMILPEIASSITTLFFTHITCVNAINYCKTSTTLKSYKDHSNWFGPNQKKGYDLPEKTTSMRFKDNLFQSFITRLRETST